MSHESIPMLFEDCHGRPVPRLFRDPDGNPRTPDGARYFSAEQAASHFKMPVADLEQFWLDVWADLIHRDNAAADSSAEKIDDTRLQLIHDLKHPELCDEHFQLLAQIAKQLGFNLWTREIYGKITHNALTGHPEMMPVVGIYGLRRKAHESGQFGGCDAPVWEPSDDERRPAACRVTVYRVVNGERHAYTGVALWHECAPDPGVSDWWDRQPFSALEQRAEAKALRKAFGEFVGGLYLPDEVPTGDRKPRPSRAQRSTGPTAEMSKSGEEPPTTRIGFEIAAKSLGFQDDRHRGHIIGMLKAKFGPLFDNDERTFWVKAFEELRSNPRKYAPPTAM